ncbi:hypothetical protein DFP72DRAFT_892902 [Ephemerocybe angulata]|uniref:Uncharacterized protein n=1 Tax=Ephemerocybe angulata TaxID=980116 RepID=A0A8H6M5Z0_9AGAR|nr:hypothetical protein DFP72DRAFT_892902 [Tulosesus angulatus]
MQKSFSLVLAAVLLSSVTAAPNNDKGGSATTSTIVIGTPVIPVGAPGCGSLITSIYEATSQTTIGGTLTTFVPFTTTSIGCANNATGPLITSTIYPAPGPTGGAGSGSATTSSIGGSPDNCTSTTFPAYSQTTIGTVTTSVLFNTTGVLCGTETGTVIPTVLPTNGTGPTVTPSQNPVPTVSPSSNTTAGNLTLAGALAAENGAGIVGASWVAGLVAAVVGAFTFV